MTSEQKKRRAANTLASYFKTVYQAAGLRWDYDNQAEIEAVVEDLIEAIKAELAEKGAGE